MQCYNLLLNKRYQCNLIQRLSSSKHWPVPVLMSLLPPPHLLRLRRGRDAQLSGYTGFTQRLAEEERFEFKMSCLVFYAVACFVWVLMAWNEKVSDLYSNEWKSRAASTKLWITLEIPWRGEAPDWLLPAPLAKTPENVRMSTWHTHRCKAQQEWVCVCVCLYSPRPETKKISRFLCLSQTELLLLYP